MAHDCPYIRVAADGMLHGVLILLLAMLTACAAPTVRNEQFAEAQGFQRQLVRGTDFTHRVYVSQGRDAVAGGRGDTWHVYIEGDGRPWRRPDVVASDPTSVRPLMLQLMALDRGPALYLGRPCYLGQHDAACNPVLWTYGRYSAQVVDSLRAALRRLIAVYDIESLVLMGHSGGGTLAMLLAEQLAETRSVVTLAGNLDIDAWALRHSYTPLRYSLNPATRAPLPADIVQRHYVGEDDDNVPATLLQPVVNRQGNARLVVLQGVGHRRGWLLHWPEILASL